MGICLLMSQFAFSMLWMGIGVTAEIEKYSHDFAEVNTVTWVAVACISVVGIVFLLSLCGGCTPMEVGSEHHAASGGKHSSNYGGSYDTDANTRVLQSGTSLPCEPYRQQDQNQLPYALHPQGITTAQTFSGYTPTTGGYQQVATQPSAPISGGGYAGNQGVAGYHGDSSSGYQQQTSYQDNRPGANRHFSQNEPPPPDYDEAIRS